MGDPATQQAKQEEYKGEMSMERTEATAMPMAFHLLPVAANTGAATITPCGRQSK